MRNKILENILNFVKYLFLMYYLVLFRGLQLLDSDFSHWLGSWVACGIHVT
jgi:hypothetical protein